MAVNLEMIGSQACHVWYLIKTSFFFTCPRLDENDGITIDQSIHFPFTTLNWKLLQYWKLVNLVGLAFLLGEVENKLHFTTETRPEYTILEHG